MLTGCFQNKDNLVFYVRTAIKYKFRSNKCATNQIIEPQNKNPK